MVATCDELLSRLADLPDARSREILGDGLTWARSHPNEIRYNAKSAEEAIVVAPNSIGFQSVILGIAARVAKVRPRMVQVTVDRQSQFNKAQRTVTGWYQKAKGSTVAIGPGMPQMDLKGIPDSPLRFASSFESPGLELVDIYLWTLKRLMEGKEIAAELQPLIRAQLNRGRTDEISLRAMEHRWGKWFAELGEPTPEQVEKGRALLQSIEENRRRAMTAVVKRIRWLLMHCVRLVCRKPAVLE